jgi:hypothetical protein
MILHRKIAVAIAWAISNKGLESFLVNGREKNRVVSQSHDGVWTSAKQK